MNKEPKFEISVIVLFIMKKITKYKAHFALEQSVAIFFFLTAYQKLVKCTVSQLAKKKEFSPRSASAVKWVLDNIRTFFLQSKKSCEEIGITSFRCNHFGATYFVAGRFLYQYRTFRHQFRAL